MLLKICSINLGSSDPDAIRGRDPQRDMPGIGCQRQGLIVVSAYNVDASARTNTPLFQEFQQLTVALIDTADSVGFSERRIGQEQQPPFSPTARTFQFTKVSVRTGAAGAESFQELCFEIGRYRVLQALGFVVDFVPLHSEDFGQHALNQVMPQAELAGNPPAGGCKPDLAMTQNPDQSIFLQTAQGHADRGRGDR